MKTFLILSLVAYCYSAPTQKVFHNEESLSSEKLMRSLYGEDLLAEELTIPAIHLENSQLIEYNNVTMLGFSWNDCGHPSDPVQVKTMKISPDPITIPGTEVITLDATIKSTIETATQVKLVIKKKVFGFYITVPCVDNLGSCTYENPCDMLKNVTCPPEFIQEGFTCQCPFAAKEYKLDQTMVKIPAIKLPSFIENGDYEIQATVMNGEQEVACYSVTASLHAA